ncbi:MAG: chondroitin lyase [Chitinophagaceae bacterium]|nr:chondroitin lyase [Chitinophagaceae bacterium]
MARLIGLLFIILSFLGILHAQPADIQHIKIRIKADLLQTQPSDKQIEGLLRVFNQDGSFNEINYSDLSPTASFPQGRHTSNLATLAKAYASAKSKFYKNDSLKSVLIRGLRFWVEKDFVGENWHDNQITTPTNLVNLMLAAGDDLPSDLIQKAQPIIGRANMRASGVRPGGDRIVIAGIIAKNSLFIDDYKLFESTIQLIENEMKFSTGERGIQQDYSFHHRVDRVNNTDSYGYTKFANAYGEWSYYVAGTKYQFSQEKLKLLIDYYLDGIYKQMVYGIYEDVGVRNRDITIKKPDFRPRGTLEIERLFVSTDYRRNELEEIIKLRKGESTPSRSFAKFFWQTEHFVFQRPTFYTSVRMFSTRNKNMEEPYNGPGKPTHHRADGTNYLLLKGDEYFNIWPVYDWQKISGTTIMQKPALPSPTEIQKSGLTSFVGAVTDGLYGAVAFDFMSPHDLLAAKKSWFFFDEEYVCLGAGINPSKPMPVVTTINQCLLRSAVRISRNGNQSIVPAGNRAMDSIKWVYHDRVGYLFPTPTTVVISNQEETGRWSDITDQKNISKELVKESVFKLYFDHGTDINKTDMHGKRLVDTFPTYQYIVVPGISEEQLSDPKFSDRGIEIVSNTEKLQGVKNNKLGIVQLAFYRGGEAEISTGQKIQVDSQGMLMLKLSNNRITELSVSDPSRELNKISILLPGIYKVNKQGIICYPDTKLNKTRLLVELPQRNYLGASVTMQLQ